MTDYQPLLARALKGLERNTSETRRAVYDRARQALLNQLRSANPPMSDADITRERLALEDAIRKTETEAVLAEPHPVRAPSAARMLGAPQPTPRPASPVPPPHPPMHPASRPAAPQPRIPMPPQQPGQRTPPQGRMAPPPNFAPQPRRPAPPAVELPPAQENPEHSPPPVEEQPAPAENAVPPAGAEIPPDAAASAEKLPPELEPAPVPPPPAPPAAGQPVRPRSRPPFPRGEGNGAGDFPPVPQGAGPAYGPMHGPGPARGPGPGMRPRGPRPPGRAPAPGFGQGAALPGAKEKPGASMRTKILLAGLALLLLAGAGVFAFTRVRHAATDTPPAPSVADSDQPKTSERIAPSNDQAAPSQPTNLDPAVAQRAVLYEENPGGGQQFQNFVGTAVWKTEAVNAPGKAPDLGLRIEIEIPDRKINMTLKMKRNTDPSFPASHTIEVIFDVSPGDPFGGVADMRGIRAKGGETAQGNPLAAEVQKVKDGYFLLALPQIEKDTNLAFLRERDWLDIPFVYANGRRAVLTFQKGTPGERALREVLNSWGEGGASN